MGTLYTALKAIKGAKTLQYTCILVFFLVDVQSKRINAEPQFTAFLVFDVEIVDSVHLQVLRDLQVLHHGIISTMACSRFNQAHDSKTQLWCPETTCWEKKPNLQEHSHLLQTTLVVLSLESNCMRVRWCGVKNLPNPGLFSSRCSESNYLVQVP